MTHDQTTPAPVEVTQADREAAADEILWRGLPRALANAVRNGQHDDHHTVQAFTRHRIAHSAPAGEADTAAEVETMRQMREIAREMGYSDVLGALEALSDLCAPAGKVEPVAWMYHYPGDLENGWQRLKFERRLQAYEGMSCNEEDHGMIETPLYTHPAPPADLVELVEALADALGDAKNNGFGEEFFRIHVTDLLSRARTLLAKHGGA